MIEHISVWVIPKKERKSDIVMEKGIDVSEHNGIINWDKAGIGLDFTIIRLGYGQDRTDQDDKQFERNVEECERLGKPWGAYLYSYAMNVTAVHGEIMHTLRLLQGKKPSLPIYIDMEDADHYKLNHGGVPSKQTNTDIVKTFCGALLKAGYVPGWYCNKDWYVNHFYPNQLTAWSFWYARPAVSEDKMQSEVNPDIWQNGIGETGSTWHDIAGHCDTNICYMDLGRSTQKPVERVKAAAQTSLQAKIVAGKKYVGSRCSELQTKLNRAMGSKLAVDNSFGFKTYGVLIAFQRKYDLAVDGLAGSATFAKLDSLISAMNKPKLTRTLKMSLLKFFRMKGEDVKYLQKKLAALGFYKDDIDGIFGANTDKAVRAFQKAKRITIDGKVGPQTWSLL